MLQDCGGGKPCTFHVVWGLGLGVGGLGFGVWGLGFGVSTDLQGKAQDAMEDADDDVCNTATVAVFRQYSNNGLWAYDEHKRKHA